MGILIAIVVIGSFLYLKFVNKDPGRKLKRLKAEHARIVKEVDRLRHEARVGTEERIARKLRGQIADAGRSLEEAETALAKPGEMDQMAGRLVATAAEGGLIIKEFKEIKDKIALKDILSSSNGGAVYPQRYFKIVLKGRFQALKRFVSNIDSLPKLVVVRKVAIEKIEEKALIRASLWISI
jgi:Tfp pilus assembly protein PilO